jgi:hypothetical protein
VAQFHDARRAREPLRARSIKGPNSGDRPLAFYRIDGRVVVACTDRLEERHVQKCRAFDDARGDVRALDAEFGVGEVVG